MATRVTTYDPGQVTVSVGGFIITGFAVGRMIEYRPEQEVISDAEGVDGEVVRWARNNPLGTLTLELSQASESNFTLSTLLNLDRLSMAGIVPVIVTDKNGTGQATRLIAGSGWVREQPTIEWGAGPLPRRWVIRLLNVIHDIHGYGEAHVTNA